MTKSVEFRPVVKAVKMNSGAKQEIVLSIENGSLDGKFESLSQLIGEAVNVVIQPSVISYRIPYDKETGEAQLKYVLDSSGQVIEVKEEQLSLEEFGNNTTYKSFLIDMDNVDGYIKNAVSLNLPPHIEVNPRDILFSLEDGETYEEIADNLGYKEAFIISQLEKARMFFAPFAAAWAEEHESKASE